MVLVPKLVEEITVVVVVLVVVVEAVSCNRRVGDKPRMCFRRAMHHKEPV